MQVMRFIRNPEKYPSWIQPELIRCQNAPFLTPSRGFIGFVWGDSFRPFHHHQGIDIFGGAEPGVVPVYAVADGFLTREQTWKSSLVLRIPNDPMQPDRQIWVYYTHLADALGETTILESFPPGSSDIPVKQGDLLGYQGNYSGDPENPVGVHLHISILKDDGQGHYLNELLIKNTLDPSPYFGLSLNARHKISLPLICD
jgi:hypothetical protein